MPIKLTGATSGYTIVQAAAVAGSNTLTLPTTVGGTMLATDSSNALAITGDLTGSANAYFATSSGNVGIGTSSPSYKLDVRAATSTVNAQSTTATNYALFSLRNNFTAYFGIEGSAGGQLAASTSPYSAVIGSISAYPLSLVTSNFERARVDASGYMLIGYTSSNGAYNLQVNSQIFATSSTIATSDANYKINVTPLSGALDLVNRLNPVSFNWKTHPVHNFDTQTPTVGFLAQEVQSVLAGQSYLNSIIKQNEVTLPDGSKEEFLGIAEGNLIALLTKALQESVAKIDALETRIAALELK